MLKKEAYLRFRVSITEKETIINKVTGMGFRNFSDYARFILLNCEPGVKPNETKKAR